MFGKNQQEETAEEKNGNALGAAVISMLTGALFGKMHDFFTNMLMSAKDTTEHYIRQIVRRLIIGFSVVIGILFLLFGAAQVIDQVYGRPGLGEVIIGAVILLVSIVWSAIPDKREA